MGTPGVPSGTCPLSLETEILGLRPELPSGRWLDMAVNDVNHYGLMPSPPTPLPEGEGRNAKRPVSRTLGAGRLLDCRDDPLFHQRLPD